ncbi:monocarboxylate transporter 13-like [Exaiptasia diaphana]|uniref:Major facilitator superfamily (MFS) profile domain-containing protein n=1 Tax=Exaiptasia diaphana TaxID=2652724 RepID=A0A913YI77_EXADI|nr:monocarboxylate transporter 13-like [Exaiptasia diaphana]
MVLYCINYGVGDGLFATAIINIAIECLPTENRGGGFGLFQFLVGIGYIIGPILSGFIADVSGSYNYAFYTAGSLELIGGSISLALLCFEIPFVNRELDESSRFSTVLEFNITEKETVL